MSGKSDVLLGRGARWGEGLALLVVPCEPSTVFPPSVTVPPTPSFVYKVLLPEQHAEFQRSGEFHGSADDRRDGFIHLSFSHQVERTIQKHFQDRSDVFIAEFATSTWGDALRLEPSRDEQLFPHLYTGLSWSEVVRWVRRDELLGG